MPVYLYRCACGHQEDVLHSITASVAIMCPVCIEEMARVPSVGGVAFKGDGWAAKE